MSEVDRTRESLSDLSQMMATVEEQSMSLAKRFGDMSEESKKWTFVSRILSGTGLWRLQNRVRALGQGMKFYKDTQLDKVKADIKEAESMAQLQNAMESQKNQQEVLLKLKEKGAERAAEHLVEGTREYEQAMKIIDQYKLLRKTVEDTSHAQDAHKIALQKTAAAYDAVGNAIEEIQEKRTKKYQKALDKQDKKEEIRNARLILRENKKHKALLSTVEDHNKNYIKLQEKRTSLENRIKATKDMSWVKTPELEDELTELKKIMPAAALKKARAAKKMKAAGFPSGDTKAAKKTLKELTGLKATFTNVFKTIAKPLIFLKDKVGSATENYRKNISEADTWRGKLSEGFSPITKVMKFAAKNLMWFTLLLVGAFLVFSIIRKIFSNAEAMKTIMDTVKGVIEGLMTVLSGVFDIFSAFFGGGTFGERLQLLLKGIMKLWGGIGKILMTVLGAGIKLLGGLLFGIFSMLWEVLDTTLSLLLGRVWKGIKSVVSSIFSWVVNFWSGVWGGIQNWFTGTDLYTGIMNVVGWVKEIWKSFSDFLEDIDIFASGGTSRGGMAVVGERGPELVSLSAGSTVYSNVESKKMLGRGGGTTNNISVNVSGRVGSTDSELRDIAKKIGKMVSAEINRTTSSSTNVRF